MVIKNRNSNIADFTTAFVFDFVIHTNAECAKISIHGFIFKKILSFKKKVTDTQAKKCFAFVKNVGHFYS